MANINISPNGTVGTYYRYSKEMSFPYRSGVGDGNLSSTGLTFSSTLIRSVSTTTVYRIGITGTPTRAGEFYFVSGSNHYILTIDAKLAITTSSLPTPISNTSYSETLTADGATPITWSISSGSLPIGLSLSNSGVISGISTQDGNFTFTVKATNSTSSVTKSFTMIIGTKPIIIDSLNDFKKIKRKKYHKHHIETSGSTPITYTIVKGKLPPGMTLNSETGIIEGAPY